MNKKGQLFIIATPIGNMEDITARSLRTLAQVDFVLCEDTRVSQKLLNFFEIKKETLSYHQHSNGAKIREIISRINSGENAGVITDAGTPGISDPGNILVEEAIKNEIDIVAIPGVSAVVAALSVCGFPTDKFLFLGFPPNKNKRNKYFLEVADSTHTVVFYESCHRINKTISELAQVLNPERRVMIARELTKKFETIYRGTISELVKKDIKNKGEFVIVVSKKYE